MSRMPHKEVGRIVKSVCRESWAKEASAYEDLLRKEEKILRDIEYAQREDIEETLHTRECMGLGLNTSPLPDIYKTRYRRKRQNVENLHEFKERLEDLWIRYLSLYKDLSRKGPSYPPPEVDRIGYDLRQARDNLSRVEGRVLLRPFTNAKTAWEGMETSIDWVSRRLKGLEEIYAFSRVKE